MCSSKTMNNRKISTVTIVPRKPPSEPRIASTNVSILLGEAISATKSASENIASKPYRFESAYFARFSSKAAVISGTSSINYERLSYKNIEMKYIVTMNVRITVP